MEDKKAVHDQNEIDEKYKEFESSFEKTPLSDADILSKIEEIDALIDHVTGRISYTETRITRTVTLALTMVGFGMAFFAVVLNLHGMAFYLGIATAMSLILTGSIASYIHTRQINPKYPFRRMENDWKWFYPRIVEEEYRPNAFVHDKDQDFLKKRLLHMENLRRYADRLLKEDKKERLKIDTQQLFLLHVNEKYKNCFLSSLRTILKRGLIITSMLFLALSITLIVNKISNLDARSGSDKRGYRVHQTNDGHRFHNPGAFRNR